MNLKITIFDIFTAISYRFLLSKLSSYFINCPILSLRYCQEDIEDEKNLDDHEHHEDPGSKQKLKIIADNSIIKTITKFYPERFKSQPNQEVCCPVNRDCNRCGGCSPRLGEKFSDKEPRNGARTGGKTNNKENNSKNGNI